MSGDAFGRGIHRHAPLNCPKCGYLLTASHGITDEEEKAPEDGDTSMCVQCGSINVYTDAVTGLRTATADERAEALRHREVQAAVLMHMRMRNLNRRRPPPAP